MQGGGPRAAEADSVRRSAGTQAGSLLHPPPARRGLLSTVPTAPCSSFSSNPLRPQPLIPERTPQHGPQGWVQSGVPIAYVRHDSQVPPLIRSLTRCRSRGVSKARPRGQLPVGPEQHSHAPVSTGRLCPHIPGSTAEPPRRATAGPRRLSAPPEPGTLL